MAKKFGGTYSPNGAKGSEAVRKVDAAGAKAAILFVPGIVLAALSLNEGAEGLATGLIGASVLTLAAWLTRDGLRAAAAFDQRKVARKPAIPHKILGSAVVGIAIASWTNDPSMIATILYGGVAAGVHSMAVGIDPLRDKRMEGIDTFQHDRVAKVVDEGERKRAEAKKKLQNMEAELKTTLAAAKARGTGTGHSIGTAAG
jgi:hypothetical protein